MNLFKTNYEAYIRQGLSVIPDKFGTKLPAIKGWSAFCSKLPSNEEIEGFCKIENSNISMCLGEASGIIALDVDSTDQRILDIVVPMLPSSPVEKIGAKGFTRFFRFNGENSMTVKFNGEMVLEVLSEGKKTTMPPSRHPSGVDYRYTTTETLLTVNKNDLPYFPPFLLANIESKLRLHFPLKWRREARW